MSRLFNLEASPFFPKSVLDLYQRKRLEVRTVMIHNLWSAISGSKIQNVFLILSFGFFQDMPIRATYICNFQAIEVKKIPNSNFNVKMVAYSSVICHYYERIFIDAKLKVTIKN